MSKGVEEAPIVKLYKPRLKLGPNTQEGKGMYVAS